MSGFAPSTALASLDALGPVTSLAAGVTEPLLVAVAGLLTLVLVGLIAIALVLFQSAYMAETVRGGLQTLARGQREAGTSLGLTYWQLQRAIVLPQALVAVIPAFVNNLLSTFMDTSLVTVVSMYDLTGALRLALGDPVWRDFFIEGYAFIAAIYFVSSFAMSRYSQWLERRLKAGAH